MFHVPTFRSALAGCGPTDSGRRSGHALALLTGAALLIVLAATPHPSPAPVPEAAATGSRVAATLVLSPEAGLPALQAAAEGLRARLRAVPGVGAVGLHGLRTAGLEVQYAPSHLLQRGVREADIEAAVPAGAPGASPGHVPVRADVADAGTASVAGLPVQAGRRVLRLGDLAAVVRIPLPAPVSTLSWNGRPAVTLTVTPAPGAGGAALSRRVAASVSGADVPAGVQLR